MTDSFRIAVFIGLFFAPLGGLTAAIITFAEYRQHITKRAAVGEAMRMGLFATAFLAAVTTAFGWLMGKA